MTERRHKYSIRFTTIDVGGQPVIVYVVHDLDDDLLLEHLQMAFDKEDYEYCDAISAECKLRNLKVKIR